MNVDLNQVTGTRSVVILLSNNIQTICTKYLVGRNENFIIIKKIDDRTLDYSCEGTGGGGDNDFVFVKTDLNEMMLRSPQ